MLQQQTRLLFHYCWFLQVLKEKRSACSLLFSEQLRLQLSPHKALLSQLRPEEPEVDEEAAAQAAREATFDELKVDFARVFKNWRKVATAIDWRALSKLLDLGLDLAEDVVITPMDLWYVDMAAVLK